MATTRYDVFLHAKNFRIFQFISVSKIEERSIIIKSTGLAKFLVPVE
jgi:hypothetical protein